MKRITNFAQCIYRPTISLHVIITTLIYFGLTVSLFAQTPIKVALIGNSTVTADKGWGGRLSYKFQDHVTIYNAAASGRSSKSWYDEGRLPAVLAENPDYIFIEFGHNDQPGKGADRETDPETTFQDYLKIYIDAARSIGATPVIISPVTRRYFGSDGKIDTTWSGYLDDYADGAKAIATAENVAFINLFYLSVAHHNEIGETASMAYNGPSSADDITHFNTTGAKEITNIIVEEIEAVIPELAAHLLINSYDDICSPVGWATHDGSVTGGEGGDTVWVSTFEDFKTEAASVDPQVIIITGSIGTGGGSTSRVYVKSNKTILGYGNAELHGSIFVSNATNVIIRNLKVRGDGAHDRDGEDCMALSNSERVWVDHVEFEDGGDGNLDIVRESNYVTVSWCKFSYTSKSTYHQWSNLNGNSDDRITDRGKLKITFHHNYWAEGCVRRMPNVRFGKVHVVNNYYRTEQKDDFCIGATKEADLLIENNAFEKVNNPLMYTNESTAAQMRNNLFIAAPGDKTGHGTAFTPPYPYTMTPVNDVENVVRFSVGRRDLNDLFCSGSVFADCNGTPDGTAYEDNCGVCVGGTTGLEACSEKIEGETACEVDGDANESSNTGFSGTGYVNTTNAIGSSVTYMITSDQDQEVEFGYRFANGGTDARPGTIYVNGQAGNAILFPSTGSWTAWESGTITIDLVEGANKVEIRATTAGGLANLDYLSLYDNSVSSASCTDCNGDLFGTASINDCGVCSGGLTNVDPNATPTWYADADNDGLGNPLDSIVICEQPDGYVSNSNDVCLNDQKNVCNYQFDDLCAPVGWATYNGATNGGSGGDTVHVSTFADLKSHAESEGATVIFLSGSVGTGNGADSRIYVNSNKTILGHLGAELHGYFIIDGESNIIIRNLKLRGDGARDNGSDDVISVITGTRLWFDHLDISDGEDGNLDIKRESNYITISWCKFSYTSASTAHEFSNLIGHNDNHIADRNHSKVTLHHNYWAAGVKQRMPRVRFGQVHIVNNYYRSDSDGNDYCIGAGKEADLLIENNVFELVTNPLNYIGGAATAVNLNNNLFTNAPGDKTETGTAFTPPYAYTMTPVNDVENLVRFSAGQRELRDILCSDQIESDCNEDLFGTATIDDCDVCSGGLTGVVPNDDCTITSVNSQINDSIYLFPNPTNDFINISESTTWKLVNINGGLLSKGEGEIIDLTNIPSGVYVIIIGIEHYRVIKK